MNIQQCHEKAVHEKIHNPHAFFQIADTAITRIVCGPSHIVNLYTSGYDARGKTEDQLVDLISKRLDNIIAEAPSDFTFVKK